MSRAIIVSVEYSTLSKPHRNLSISLNKKLITFSFHCLRLFIDTPEKFEQLKAGAFDNKYKRIVVTSDATADVLLQPQHFSKSAFQSLQFIALNNDGNNTITIWPGQYSQATIQFRNGENPLSGVPKDYSYYQIDYGYPSIPTDENIDAILSWSRVWQLKIYDQEDVAIKLTQRSAELKQMKGLNELYLSMQDDTYDQINVAAIINNLPALYEIDFTGQHMSSEQMKDFEARNPIPAGWKGWIIGKLIYYRNK